MRDFSELIEALKKDTELLEAERAKADAIFLGIGDGAIATDEKGIISRVNATGAAMLGYIPEQLVGKWYPKTFIAVDEQGKQIPTIERPITQAFLTGKACTASNFFFKRKDGSTFPVSLSAAPILLDNRPIGAVQVFKDITTEYEVDRMKSEFISLASHQLRTPLASIMTNSHLLADGYVGALTEDQQAFMDNIVYSVDRMHELISLLLNITRIEGGKMAVTPKPTEMKNLIEEVCQEAAPMLEEKQQDIKAELKRVTISTDPLLIREIIANLLSNAIKYTPPKGKITLKLTTTSRQLLLNIKDTGYGIPEHQKKQIFTKFFRAANVVEKEGVGTGLGLYMIKGIAEHLGGQLWFESKEGKGTTFFFSLPLKGSTAKAGTMRLEASRV